MVVLFISNWFNSDYNECQGFSYDCPVNATCVNNDGSYTCRCPSRYRFSERTVQVSSFKYLKYLLDENDKNSELRTDAVNFRNFDIVRQLSLP